jgi:hypothetical protein
METSDIIDSVNKVGDKVFLNPSQLFDIDMLINCSLGLNTYRGFHKIDKSKEGSKKAFTKVLADNSTFIFDSLNSIKTISDLDDFERTICDRLYIELNKNIKENQLESFNKIRKPVDILIEHFVSMSKELERSRTQLIPFLFLPLDSQMFKSELIFSDAEIKSLRIKRNYTFSSIKSESQYFEIQDFLLEKSARLGVKNRIYLDLIWNDRYKSKKGYLFGTNHY